LDLLEVSVGDSLGHSTSKTLSDGNYYPLGATLAEGGVNFALYSQNASKVFLILFDHPSGEPTDVIELKQRTKFIWHVFVRGLQAGQLYGYRVCGPYDPKQGLRFNQHKLLLDPYAKAVTGKCRNLDNLLLGYDPFSPEKDLSLDTRDNTAFVPKAIVIDDQFDWQGIPRPEVSLEKLVIYETHLKGFTAHPSSRVTHPGTYLGFIERISHLRDLGINAVELLPIHEFYVDDFLLNRGLTNYWGYNTLGFFAPEYSYSTQRTPGCQVGEFKTLVRELHRAGISLILDVVYNHTGEGNELGPTICFKGIDNPNYYALTGPADQQQRYYMNYTGCGNSVDLSRTAALRLVMDSLRYWVEVMQVDGFRFDLASVLGRGGDEKQFQRSAVFFDAISQDPILNRTILIAEPWDLGTYEVGNFPVDWSEWNGRFRDTMRKFGKGDPGQLADLGWRLTGSADLYGEDGRSAYNSVNFITCHDGFTLNDLVSYNEKHNELNGENNTDGTNDNASWNCGAEGPSTDPAINQLRRQLVKNYALYLLFSSGTPMLLGGDEFLRTQLGNNNAYCQDNEISWFDWNLVEQNSEILSFFRKAIAFTRRYTILQRRKFLLGEDLDANNVPDLEWFGLNLDQPAWGDPSSHLMCFQLDGGEEKSEVGDYRLFIILNSDYRLHGVSLPHPGDGMRWYRVIDTSLPSGEDFLEAGFEIPLDPAERYLANPRSTVVLLGR
jgi:isoamylase